MRYDPEADDLYLHLNVQQGEELTQVHLADDVILDVDKDTGEFVGLEIRNVNSLLPDRSIDWVDRNSSKPY